MKKSTKNIGYYIMFLVVSILILISSIFGLSAKRIADNLNENSSTNTSATNTFSLVRELSSPDFIPHTTPSAEKVYNIHIETTTSETEETTTPESTASPSNSGNTNSQPTNNSHIKGQQQIYGRLDEYAIGAGERVDDSFFSDALFIGDSRTEGISQYGNIKNATFYAHKGLNVITAQRSPFVKVGDEYKTLIEALKLHPEFKKIYISFGLNDYWFKENTYKEKYALLIDQIRQVVSPDAKIYICAVFPVLEGMPKSDEGLNNAKMIQFNRIALEIAKERGLSFIDLSEVFVKPDGYRYLTENESIDGVHLYRPEIIKICDYLRTHT